MCERNGENGLFFVTLNHSVRIHSNTDLKKKKKKAEKNSYFEIELNHL